MLRVAGLTLVAMLAFAANSVLARLALAAGDADALGYTGIRIAAGAITLAGLLALRERPGLSLGGSWRGAGALLAYAVAFSVAYLMLNAGAGALILFASVQVGMLAWALRMGDRPGRLEWLGLAVAFAGLVFLMSPGLAAPHPLGAALMAVAGLSWAAYSLLGRGSGRPLADTAGNFVRCLPAAMALALAGVAIQPPSLAGVAYAVASGAVASGIGYAIWYAALPGLSRSAAAFVQLTVPAIAAAGGVLFLQEPMTARLVLASAGILGGVALALFAAERRRMRSSKD
ncbi:MAG: DMT family transporter [Alphaproteobacteria bacterium]